MKTTGNLPTELMRLNGNGVSDESLRVDCGIYEEAAFEVTLPIL